MPNPPTASGRDAELLREVELCTTLLIASSGYDRLLTQAEVDHFLGVRPRPPV